MVLFLFIDQRLSVSSRKLFFWVRFVLDNVQNNLIYAGVVNEELYCSSSC